METTGAAGQDGGYVDSLYLRGARGMVPCTDGSFVGGYINCPGRRLGGRISDQCVLPMITRSWDGGKTWHAEQVDAPDHAFSGIVRLRHGVLLTAHNRWMHSFIQSTDNGRTWHPTFDSTQADTADNNNITTGFLIRDDRGILFWWLGAGGLMMSIDEGRSFIGLSGADIREGYYVLAPDGLLVTHLVQAGTSPGSIQMSFNHGRSWVETLRGYDRYGHDLGWRDSTSTITGAVVIRDTVAVNDRFGFYPDGGLRYEPRPRTLYWQADQRTWNVGRFLHSFGTNGIMDSTECFYTGAFATLALYPEDNVRKIVSREIPVDSIPKDGDTMVYTRGRLYDHFYDLEGNIHPHGSGVYVPRRALRPVSRLDRLYTCTGVEYVVGGQYLDTVMLDTSRSDNAKLTYTMTPNRRMATVVIEARDTVQPLRFTMIVDDSLVGRQWFTDSVLTTTVRPVIADTQRLTYRYLTCTYAEGPFMWYYNDTLMPHPKWIGMYGDSLVMNPRPGRYKAVGKSRYGCDVFSNEVVITTTHTNENVLREQFSAQTETDGTIVLRWTDQNMVPASIHAYDVLGRRLDCDIVVDTWTATISIVGSRHPVILHVVSGRHSQALLVR